MAKRPGLTQEKLLDAAVELLEQGGLDTLSLTTLAQSVGVKPPSLYNHIKGLPDLLQQLRLLGLKQLHWELQQAIMGRAGYQALHAACHAYRNHALQHPQLYRLTLRSTENEDNSLQAIGQQLLQTLLMLLQAYNLQPEEKLHAARSLRSALHGFVSLEIEQGFALQVDNNSSFDYLLRLLDLGFTTRVA